MEQLKGIEKLESTKERDWWERRSEPHCKRSDLCENTSPMSHNSTQTQSCRSLCCPYSGSKSTGRESWDPTRPHSIDQKQQILSKQRCFLRLKRWIPRKKLSHPVADKWETAQKESKPSHHPNTPQHLDNDHNNLHTLRTAHETDQI
jgi:hypothetical protein